MRFGFYTPNVDFCGDASVLADLAHRAEEAGWDGFFIWDCLQYKEPTVDPWIALTAMAMRTERIRLGPVVTPVPRRHIAKLAREVISLDHLSNGRIVLGVGAGYPAFPEYTAFGDDGDPKTRASKLDEGLEVLAGLWSGKPVQHHGTYYHVECDGFQPPVQQPRVPVWVAATWPAKKPLRRAARWDGVVPMSQDPDAGPGIEPGELRCLVDYIAAHRSSTEPFDVVQFGRTNDPHDTAKVEVCAEAGATWWLEYLFTEDTSLEGAHERLRKGPPRR